MSNCNLVPNRRCTPARWWAATVVLLATTLAARVCRADFFSNPLFPVGEAAGLMGGAAAAAVDDGSALWYNPAGLGLVRDQGISGSLSAYGVQRFKVAGFVEYSPGSKAALTSTAVVTFPSYLGYVQPLGGSRFQHGIGLAIVVPDFARFDGIIDVPSGTLPFELRGRTKLVSQTIWGLPGWGGCGITGRFCLGASLALAYMNETQTSITDARMLGATEQFLEQSFVDQRDLWTLSVGGLVGVQWQLTQGLRVGVSVRSPMRKVEGKGSLLSLQSQATSVERSSVRRVEDQDLRLDYRLPLQARAGFSLQVGRFRLAADVNVSPAEPAYAYVRGHNGETKLQPLSGAGAAMGEPIDIWEDLQRNRLIDGAVGLASQLGERWILFTGFFTNRTGADKIRQGFGNVLGATLGVSRRGAKTTTRLGLTGVAGSGTATGKGIVMGGPGGTVDIPADYAAYGLYLNIGGTAAF